MEGWPREKVGEPRDPGHSSVILTLSQKAGLQATALCEMVGREPVLRVGQVPTQDEATRQSLVSKQEKLCEDMSQRLSL